MLLLYCSFTFFFGKWLRLRVPNLGGPVFKATRWLQGQTQPFILPRLIKWVPRISGELVVKSKPPPRNGSEALRQYPIVKKGSWSFFKKSLIYNAGNWKCKFLLQHNHSTTKNDLIIWDHSFSSFTKFSKKLIFLTTWYTHVCVRIRG